MLLPTLALYCFILVPSDAPKNSVESISVVAGRAEETVIAKPADSKLPDAPTAKSEPASDANANLSTSAETLSPAGDPFVKTPAKPAARGSYETARERKIWYGLMAAGHSAAIFDAYSTRRAVSGGYGTESDPLMRPFAHSNAMYFATQVSPAIMDYLGHRMMTSNHLWMRRWWWVPQAAGTSLSLSAGVHNYRLVP